MAKFRVGQKVLAPIYRFPYGDQAPYAMAQGTVRAVSNRSCEVELPYVGTRTIASARLHGDRGVCIVRIGDFKSELEVIDPICKSVLHFLRLLLCGEYVRLVELRTFAELDEFFELNASLYSLWIVVGHATLGGELCFTRGNRMRAMDLASTLAPHVAVPTNFLFLSCNTGLAAFAKPFSSATSLCDTLIAPLGALHSAVASQFAQTLLSYLYLEGCPIGVAFNKAAEKVPASTKFRLWRKGRF
jgi:hypothetical protein